jgi:outer membrane protein assembly factor BamB
MSDITSQVQPTPTPPRVPDYDEDHFKPPITRSYRLRLWPAVVLVAVLWLLVNLPKMVELEVSFQIMALFMGPMVIGGLLVLWWLFASRIAWSDRLLGLAYLVGVGAGAFFLFHPSLAALQIMALTIYALPWVMTAWVGWLLVSSYLNTPVRRIGFLVVILATWGYFDLIKLNGMNGSFHADFLWRWQQTPEERNETEIAQRMAAASLDSKDAKPVKAGKGDWPCFRGENRDSRLVGVVIDTDWKANPPKKLWSRPVGPSWSSFAVVGDNLYTQEQLGNDEVVLCLDAKTGDVRWVHKDPARLIDSIAGTGPRATPTFHEGKIYALGAKGNLNCLDAATGKKIWSADIVEDSKAKVPTWGFSSSPLVVDGIVTVFAGNTEDKSVLGYHADTGKLAWAAGKGGLSYSSLQLAKLSGVEQILLTSDVGLTSFQPKTGEILWEAPWSFQGPRCTQPAILNDGDVLLGTGMSKGTHRLHVAKDGPSWNATDVVWESRAISPYYNDLVIQDGYLYGFDSTSTTLFTCVRLEDGKSQWRARGYDNGQVLLLADQKLLLILTETGEVALVEAQPGKHKEIARIPAIKGKTWNHPVVAHGKLFVRNGEEMACFELKTK